MPFYLVVCFFSRSKYNWIYKWNGRTECGHPAVILKDRSQWNCRDSEKQSANELQSEERKTQPNKCYCFGFIEFQRVFQTGGQNLFGGMDTKSVRRIIIIFNG